MWSRLLLIAALAACVPAEEFDPGRLEQEPLVTDARDAVQLEVAADGEVYFIERSGALRCWSPRTRATRVVGQVPTQIVAEGGLIGLSLARDFATTRQLFLLYTQEKPERRTRLVRMTVTDGRIDPASERVLLEYPVETSHCGGGMMIDGKGDLWLCTGDNTHPRVTPATDQRPQEVLADAFRTAANSQDLRGKVLRLHPEADGGYSIPSGNLFTDATQGRPEIYVMGCRNPYRLTVDDRSGTLYWGEVGSNTEERFGTGGFDEINRTTAPGYFGWPQFIGPNTPYRAFDFAANKVGDPYDAAAPRNESRNNTGLKELPPAKPAWIWYPSEDSPEFPQLGNGGRAAMVGPLYHYDAASTSAVKLPAEFDGMLFIYDWCRNWIKTVEVKNDGSVGAIRPFLENALLRRPIELKPGPDGALYLIEFGEQWGGNRDGRISRIVYRRGNRAPLARISAPLLAGAAPFTTTLSAAGSSDPDGDPVTYRWNLGDGGAAQDGATAMATWRAPGLYQATLTVTDAAGLSGSTTVRVAVGNSVPQVAVSGPRHGGFFDWGQSIAYAVDASDAEDGTAVTAAKLQVRWRYQDQPASARGGAEDIGHDGIAAVMRSSDCLSCHTLATPSVGPSFRQIAERYRLDSSAAERLATKITQGGAGVWGPIPMVPHPQHTPQQVKEMATYILATPGAGGNVLPGAASGSFTAPEKPAKNAGGRLLITASYTDAGANGLPPQTGEGTLILHARRTRAALFDDSRGISIAEVSTLRRARRICAQLGVGSHLVFRMVDLAGIAQIACEVSASTGHGGVLELHADRPDGPLIGRVDVPVTGQWDEWKTVTIPVADPGGLHDLYVVGGALPGGEQKKFNLDVLEFVAGAK